jgi:hypothetical protein
MSSQRKAPNLWAIASVTYGVVIFVTVLSIVAYYYASHKFSDSQASDMVRAVTVGSVWMPIYPGATIASTASTPRDSATESTLNFESTDQADRVLSFYQAALKKGVFRFETVKKDAGGGGSVRSVVHQGKTTVVVTVHPTGGSTQGEIRTLDRDKGDKDTHN